MAVPEPTGFVLKPDSSGGLLATWGILETAGLTGFTLLLFPPIHYVELPASAREYDITGLGPNTTHWSPLGARLAHEWSGFAYTSGTTQSGQWKPSEMSDVVLAASGHREQLRAGCGVRHRRL